MEKNEQLSGIAALKKGSDFFHPGFSVDCVVLGFHEGILKIVLNRYRGFEQWRLPGSFVFKDEDVDAAANHILKERTGLDQVFLRQFYLFGSYNRIMKISKEGIRTFKEMYGIDISENHWFSRRYMTVGYYALVDFSKVRLSEGYEGEAIQWLELNDDINYFGDHQQIVVKALKTIRLQLSILPIGKELLPEKFTIPELRILYETILGKSLDRRNFQRKMLSYGYIENLNSFRRGGAHKAPGLYRFNSEKYELALDQGFEVE